MEKESLYEKIIDRLEYGFHLIRTVGEYKYFSSITWTCDEWSTWHHKELFKVIDSLFQEEKLELKEKYDNSGRFGYFGNTASPLMIFGLKQKATQLRVAF